MKKHLLFFGVLFGFVMFLGACANAEQADATTEETTEQVQEAPATEEATMEAEGTETQEGGGTEVQ